MNLLSPADMEVLEFERTPWKYMAAKEQAIRERFGTTGPKPLAWYFQRLNAVLNLPAAEEYDPELVRRLRRLRDQRAALHFRRPVGSNW